MPGCVFLSFAIYDLRRIWYEFRRRMLWVAEHEVRIMEFRWPAALALWTMLAGPIFAPPGPSQVTAKPIASQASR